MDLALRVENLWKEYRLGVFGHGMLFRDLQSWWARLRGRDDPNTWICLTPTSAASHGNFWALKGVTLDVKQGEVLGIIGRNGAGKSTLLKILSRVTAPTRGEIRTKGRVASLLEVGTGFHPELTGRENVFLNGAILGMKVREIQRKFDEIVDFSGVERFIDTPVKRYSSGMYVRLAFAVAAHLECEILLVDEVLAVGDAEFQKKCLGKMGDVARGGKTVLFVSHQLAAVSKLCTRSILLEDGMLEMQDATENVVRAYLARLSAIASIPLSDRKDRRGSGAIRLVRLTLQDQDGINVTCFHTGRNVRFLIEFDNLTGESLFNLHVSMEIDNHRGDRVTMLDSKYAQGLFSEIQADARAIVIHIDRLPLMPGVYRFNLCFSVNEATADHVIGAGEFTVEAGAFFDNGAVVPTGQAQVLVGHAFSVS